MPSLDDHFRALTRLPPPDDWPDLSEREPRMYVPAPGLGRPVGAAVLALVVAAAGFVFAIRAFRADQRPPGPASHVENGLIVFSRGGREPGLYVMNPDGSGVSRLTSREVDQDPAWSPDGSRIAFVRGFWDEDAGIYVMNADGTGAEQVTDGGPDVDGSDLNPEWSPDGARIAFAHEGRPEGADVGNTDIYVVNADGTGLARLTGGPVMEYAPTWSPDGSRIAFVGYDLASGGRPPSAVRLYVMNAEGSGVHELGPENVEGPAWSPDGSEIAYVDTETGSIMAVRPDGTGPRRIVDVAELVGGVHLVFGATWSPDGTKIAFSAGPESTDMHIYVVNRDGSGVVQLTDGPAPDDLPAWQPVVVEDASPTPEPSALPEGTIDVPADAVPEGTLLVRTDAGPEILRAGSETSSLVPGVDTPLDLSPNGSSVLGSTGIGTPADELVLVDLQTGQRRTLVRSAGDDVLGAFAQWSPDGSLVAYMLGAGDPVERSSLCVVALATSEPACFPQLGRVFAFDWSPDGSRVVVAGPPEQPVRILDVATGEVTDVVPQEGASSINDAIRDAGLGTSFQLVGPKWSPSGTYLAALANLEDSDFSYVPVVFTTDGRFVSLGRASGEFPEPFEWSPVSDVLVYTRGEAPYRVTEAYVLDAATGDDRVVLSGDEPEPFVVTNLAWAPSGRWLALGGFLDEGEGYYQVSLRILDVADPTAVHAFGPPAGDAGVADWGP